VDPARGSSTRTATSGSARRARSPWRRPTRRPAPTATRAPLLLRDCGSPLDTTPLQARDDLPEIIRAGRHLAGPSATSAGCPVDLDDPGLLPEHVAEQAAAGDGWVKLVGDWIDRGLGDLAPLWPDDVLVAAIDAAHAAGARVTAHVFGAGRAAGPDQRGHRLHRARHRAHRRPDRRDGPPRHRAGAHADQRGDVPRHRRVRVALPGVRRAHARAARGGGDVVRTAVAAGVPVYAGTDAGGSLAHGLIVDEVLALHAAGHPDAVGAASWGPASGWAARRCVRATRPTWPSTAPTRAATRRPCASLCW
jgi:hypothetical protein